MLASAVALGACGADPDEATPPATETTLPADTTVVEAPERPGRIADDCPALDEAIDIPAVWPGDPLEAVAGGEPLEIDLAIAIDADCLVIADTYAAALPVATPNLGSIEVVDGLVVAFVPPSPPADVAAPATPWWGEDRVRVCTNTGGGRLGCTNLDIDVWRTEVPGLVATFEATTRPRLLSPLTRGGSNGNGTSIAGVARLQDAFGATWALSLVATAVEQGSAPPAVVDACASLGVDSSALWPAAEIVLAQFAALVDITSVELTTVMGREPPEDLAAVSDQAFAAVEAWAACQLPG
jgi:hypothetical protein